MLGNTRFIQGGCCLRVTPHFETKSHVESLGQRTLVSPICIDCGADSEQIPCPKTPKGENAECIYLWLQLLVSFHLWNLIQPDTSPWSQPSDGKMNVKNRCVLVVNLYEYYIVGLPIFPICSLKSIPNPYFVISDASTLLSWQLNHYFSDLALTLLNIHHMAKTVKLGSLFQ